MVYLWAFIAFLLLIGVIVLATALFQAVAEREKLGRELAGAAIERNGFVERVEKLSAELESSAASNQRIGKAARLYRDKYGHIMDVEAEVERLQQSVANFEAKRRELDRIEEDLFYVDVGLYKPHHDWSDSKQYREALDAHYDRHKEFVKEGRATACDTSWSVRGSEKEGERLTKDLTKLVLRAFNAECEAAIGKVRWNNFGVMENRITKAHESINKLVVRWKLRITDEYLNLWLQELVLTYEYKEQQEKEREEQQRIRELQREEERAQKELAKAQEEAEEDEQRVEKALANARLELESAHAEDAQRFNDRIAQLEAELAEAHEKKERAKSLAEMTKVGHVYIISNIGSFGENVFKIGMTRRADPHDRIKELGDASVPFFFDVHGMIFCENAPQLEYDLHELLWEKRVNLFNDRKEFFNVTMEEIIAACNKLGRDVQLTLLAEAKEYRQTRAARVGGIAAASEGEQLSRAFH